MKSISNSEITVYNECTRKHYYAYTLLLTPKSLAPALYRGIIGHGALEVYYKALMRDAPVEAARILVNEYLDEALFELLEKDPDDITKLAIIAELRKLLDQYITYYGTEGRDNFKVLAVEKVYLSPIVPEELYYGAILDTLIEYTSGPFRGDRRVMDHKFVYNFKSEKELAMDMQLPKQIKVVQDNGSPFLHKAIFNQIRYRALKSAGPEDIFKRTDADTSKIEIEGIWNEQADTAIEMHNSPRQVRRTLAPMVCKNCDFYRLCKMQLQGQDISVEVAMNFKQRDRVSLFEKAKED